MRVLMINSPNRTSEPPRHYPYGPAILGAVLRENGHEMEVFDGNFHSPDRLVGHLRRHTYDLIGISGLVTTFSFQREVAKLARGFSKNAVIASGGGLANAVQAELLNLIPALDLVFVGEAEKTILEFLRSFRTGGVGIAYRHMGTPVLPGAAPLIRDLDSIPLPDLAPWNLPQYFDQGSFPLTLGTKLSRRRANVLTSRGCVYHCDFCFNALGRRNIRYRSPESVLEEIARLVKDYSVDFISFLDESFTTSERHVLSITEGMKRTGWNLRWGVAARSTSVNAALLKEMKSAGCEFIYFGFDSGSPETLLRMNKELTVEHNVEAFCLSVEAGICPVPNIIIGYDNEALANITDNYEFFDRLITYGRALRNARKRAVFERGFNNFGAIYIATPYPGSQLYARNAYRLPPIETILERVSGKDAYELTVNVSTLSDDVLRQQQQKMELFVRGFSL